MDWELFLGGFIGAAIGTIISILILVLLVFLYDKFTGKPIKSKSTSLNDILEKQVHHYLVDNWETLFPNWQIYDPVSEEEKLDERRKPKGFKFAIKRGEIDILCIDPKGDLIVIELKRDRPSDRVVAQIDRYITYVEGHIAQSDQRVKGIILARSFDNRLEDSIKRRRNITLWTFDWRLKIDKRPNLSD